MALDTPFAAFHAPTHRLINSGYPTLGVFDDLVSPEDAEAAMELEGLTNDRLSGALGRLEAIAPADRAFGQTGASMAMAAFLHPSPGGGRFNTDRLGAWYAACDRQTAIAETLFHHERRLRTSAAVFPATIKMARRGPRKNRKQRRHRVPAGSVLGS
ncbi:MAG: RES domain-containing protein [Alphaproteobacteria bacterium]|jgi:hypothetical protein|nr:RES domain-containing protein [Alphaproteobacteria bacterium]